MPYIVEGVFISITSLELNGSERQMLLSLCPFKVRGPEKLNILTAYMWSRRGQCPMLVLFNRSVKGQAGKPMCKWINPVITLKRHEGIEDGPLFSIRAANMTPKQTHL